MTTFKNYPHDNKQNHPADQAAQQTAIPTPGLDESREYEPDHTLA
jgi:hypothetical protein